MSTTGTIPPGTGDATAVIAFVERLPVTSARGRALPRILFLTDRARIRNPIAVAEHLPKGSGVILRDYGYDRRAELATALSDVCARRELVFLVAADADLARTVGADGVHFPEGMVDQLRAIRKGAPDMMLTAAAHDGAALRRAHDAGADAALLSPVFPTASHPGAPFLGIDAFRALVLDSPLPVYALGGIDRHTVHQLAGLPIAGVAAIGSLAMD